MKYIIIFFMLFFLIISCSNNKKNLINKRTEIFKTYLENNFKLKIKDDIHYYILISDFGCKGCKEKNINELINYLNENNKSLFTIISADFNIAFQKLIPKTNYILDINKSLETLNLDLANVTLIEVKDKNITLIKSFNPNDPPITDFIKLD